MIPRHLENTLRRLTASYPVVTLTGPRQSGKTTLVRATFPDYAYMSLEVPHVRETAATDPKGFLNQFPQGVILDEAQRLPDLFSYIQASVDERDAAGQFVVTGSQNFLLLERVTQSLAGRAGVLHLLPFSRAELLGRPMGRIEDIGRNIPQYDQDDAMLMEVLHTGFYPRIHDKPVLPQEWLANYYQTYVERDVRSIQNVGDLEAFGRFMRLCAGRTGQLLNLNSLSADCGISHTTARRWLSVLEASFITFRLQPHYRNFRKRLVKSPKLYFYDTGLLCYLLGIRTPEELVTHSSRGAVFETYVICELVKTYYHQGLRPRIYFWRDLAGHEIDLLVEEGETLVPIEIKSGQTFSRDFFKGLDFWRSLTDQAKAPAALVYGGDTSMMHRDTAVYGWRDWF
jgi:uncharacterized protein